MMIDRKKIRVLMAEKKMTQEELSRRAGVNRCSVSKYLRGHTTPSLPVIGRIAEALGVPVDELIKAE